MSKIAILQLPTLPLSEARLDYYLKICKDRGAHLVMLGEYVLNSFFKELENMPKNIIKQQSDEKKKSLTELSKKYNLAIVAPLVTYSAKGVLKGIAKFSNGVYKFNEQQILMPYAHWNEAKFFANKNDEIKPFVFKHEELKIGVMFGFETYFDASFAALVKKKIDVLLVPTASTFESNARWEELLRLRALTNNIYILRANRIGAHKPKGAKEADVWKFYGDSFVASPFGEIVDRLGADEEILLANIDKKELASARSTWKFNEISSKFKY